MNNPSVVITHHAVSGRGHTVEDVDDWHYERWPEFQSELGWWVGYHYVIERTGKITQTREHWEEGAHTKGMNTSSIGVCFMGNMDVQMPTQAQLRTWDRLYGTLLEEYPKLITQPHRAYANKSCHGSLLTDDYFAARYQKITLIHKLQQIVSLLTVLLSRKRMK